LLTNFKDKLTINAKKKKYSKAFNIDDLKYFKHHFLKSSRTTPGHRLMLVSSEHAYFCSFCSKLIPSEAAKNILNYDQQAVNIFKINLQSNGSRIFLLFGYAMIWFRFDLLINI